MGSSCGHGRSAVSGRHLHRCCGMRSWTNRNGRIFTFYAGYFRDLDGNKLNAFCFG